MRSYCVYVWASTGWICQHRWNESVKCLKYFQYAYEYTYVVHIYMRVRPKVLPSGHEFFFSPMLIRMKRKWGVRGICERIFDSKCFVGWCRRISRVTFVRQTWSLLISDMWMTQRIAILCNAVLIQAFEVEGELIFLVDKDEELQKICPKPRLEASKNYKCSSSPALRFSEAGGFKHIVKSF